MRYEIRWRYVHRDSILKNGYIIFSVHCSKENFYTVHDMLSGNEKRISIDRKNFHILQDKIYCGKCYFKKKF